MRLQESVNMAPLEVQKTVRSDEVQVVTSGDAGKILPVAYFPLYREDRATGRMRINVEMSETAKMLMNAVHVTAHVYVVPYLASDRFSGMDQLNRSYMKQTEQDGSVTPFIDLRPYAHNELQTKLGLQYEVGADYNTFPVEAYNLIVSHRRRARSPKIPVRQPFDDTLAECFWKHTQFGHVVSDFDDALIDGEVELEISDAKLPIRNLLQDNNFYTSESFRFVDPVGNQSTGNFGNAQARALFTRGNIVEDIHAELTGQGVKLSLANIELAKKTATFAAIRHQYNFLSDDYIIDLLMQGVRVPEEQLSQPILLDRKTTIFGYNRRYATDAANLEESVTSGETFLDLSFRTPAMNTGGLIMVMLEIVPEQMFERKLDPYLAAKGPDDFPNAIQDMLDPEKVDIVKNKEVDVLHTVGEGTFGYEPLNAKHKRHFVRVGGKFHRTSTGAPFDEDRQRFWAVEIVDPDLTDDFYLVGDLHKNVFTDTTADAFEIIATGKCDIVGNTQFGKGLQEATDDYQKLLDSVDEDRVSKAVLAPPPPPPPAP